MADLRTDEQSGVSPKKILLVEDEPAVRVGLEDNLVFEGYHVVSCDNGLIGLETFRRERPDLVILDVMVPGMDGLEVCRQIRAVEAATPIIMLTAKGTEVDKVVGLELGADDYLTKPFAMRELFARIKAVLRRARSVVSEQPKPAVERGEERPEAGGRGVGSGEADGKVELEELAFGEVFVDFRTYRARRGEVALSLSAKEFELLKYLAGQPDVPVTRDELLDHVWGYNSYPTTRTVDNFIARLRQKVEPAPDKPRHLLTVHGVGYKFVA